MVVEADFVLFAVVDVVRYALQLYLDVVSDIRQEEMIDRSLMSFRAQMGKLTDSSLISFRKQNDEQVYSRLMSFWT